MWVKKTYDKVETSKTKRIKASYKVEGSKGNVYKVLNDDGKWNCSCPAFGWSRGKDCKHIKQLKLKV
jgi:predicted nucleic acid-binding Zn finger protein